MWGSLLSECLSKLCDGHNSVRDCGPSQFKKMFIQQLKGPYFPGYWLSVVMGFSVWNQLSIPIGIDLRVDPDEGGWVVVSLPFSLPASPKAEVFGVE